jgi:hypothetical protein
LGLIGSITRTLFGGSKGTNESRNKFADDIKGAFLPWAQQGSAGMGMASNILGLGGDGNSGANALNNWFNTSGGKFMLDQGMDQIMGNRAAGGLLRSGGTGKELENYRSGLASTKLNEYLGNVFNVNQQALGAGSLVSGAGQYSKGKSTSNNSGLGSALGAIFASDPRLKENVVKVGEEPDGLGIYEFDYLPIEGQIAAFMPEGRQRGVMADEVAALRPWALGPTVEGFGTVRYDLL